MLKKLKKHGGVLVLPNHPALLDPVFVILYLWPKFHMHPLVIEYVYRQTGVHFLMKLIGALSVPNLESSFNEIKIKKVEQVIQTIIDGIKGKDNFLLYPAGRLKHTGKEIIGGASTVHTILQSCEDVKLVLVRTTGMWGSSFSRAYERKSPDIKKTFSWSFKKLLASGIFFLPRRKVLIEIEEVAQNFPYKGSRIEVNRFLEKWYNHYPSEKGEVDVEPLSRVSYSRWKKEFKEPFSAKETEKIKKSAYEFSSEIEKEVYTELLRIHPDIDITATSDLAIDLGMDSLDIAEVVNFLNVRYDIVDVHPENIQTVQDILELASGTSEKKVSSEPASTFHWPYEEKRLPPELPMGKTIQESFLKMCDRMQNASVCGDDMMGPLSYKRLKLAALALSEQIKKMPGEKIAVLLPATCAAYIVIFAILLANKIPVMLNWTLGPRFLNHMMKVTQAQVVISSWRFLEKLSNVEFGDLTDHVHLLEDIKKNVSKVDKAKAFYYSLKKAKSLLKALKLSKKDENDTAVILFTSGTEANPKGVPLSHKNILSNQRSAMQCADLNANDIIYGILPPFHSFGFSLAGLFPILCGMRVAFYPDPTDSVALAEGVKRWKITFFCTAPSFLRGLLSVASKKQLESVRYFMTGAEKTPQELYQRVEALGKDKKLLEGYGITECSPVISLNRPNRVACGVGQLLPGIDLCTVDPETHRLLEEKREGEICVRGDNIFSGYIDGRKSPFITIEGKQWYCTGDLGYLDDKGNLILSGRLKRFTKIGGEMVSLAGLEEVISHELYLQGNSESDGPQFAIGSKETGEGKAQIVLFSTVAIERNTVNEMLKNAGFSRLIKVSEVKNLDEIPLTGTGKIDYRFLQTLLE